MTLKVRCLLKKPMTMRLSLEEGFTWKTSVLKRKEVAWLAREVGATVSTDRLQIPLVNVSLSPSREVSLPTWTPPAPHRHHVGSVIPPNLVFGILDDVALVRLATLSFLIKEFYANPTASFACGDSLQDVQVRYLSLVKERRPDALIIDYFLDFETSSSSGEETETSISLLGVDIAERCRKEIGYEGVILIHTANEGVSEVLNYDVVDGLLPKSFTRAAYERIIGEAITRRVDARVS